MHQQHWSCVCVCVYPLQIHPPSGVTHGEAAFFTHLPGTGLLPNLLLARSKRLEIYNVR